MVGCSSTALVGHTCTGNPRHIQRDSDDYNDVDDDDYYFSISCR